MNVSGEWPRGLTLRSSWAKAEARPWNADLPYAYLRVLRGTSGFTRAAAEHVMAYGVELVASPPLASDSDGSWVKAGFEPFLDLDLYRRGLIGDLPDDDPSVIEGPSDYMVLGDIDREAFNTTWRMDPRGIRESFRAAKRSTILTVQSGPGPVAYAIVGVSGITAYLQRIAVDPAVQGHGHGRRLVRAAIRWSAGRGAATMLLNTQPENTRSAALYRSEGFVQVPSGLRVLKFQR